MQANGIPIDFNPLAKILTELGLETVARRLWSEDGAAPCLVWPGPAPRWDAWRLIGSGV